MPMGGASQQGYSPGDLKFWPGNALPPGWLKANGAAVSRSAYAALFAAIGTAYGVGDGATTFNVPDLRAEFLRALDDGRGVDGGRGQGTAQASDVISHTHNYYGALNALGGGGVYGVAGAGYTPFTSSAAGGATETRPRNVAFLLCIKY